MNEHLFLRQIPARDAGIQEFYQVGKHKSYVKMHHFYGKLDPSVKHWDDRRGATWVTPNWMTRAGILAKSS